ncbi:MULTISPECIES: DUF6153 family protein [unclassified Nocardia]|uniref:DUF6153 family protein n=1 Tax=unclassified Nocardia TaxID=2637762 RepID=UPI001CE408EF|nr:MULTISPECIES: DUF6153 family protein [unclassified Nocardia]
MVDQHRPHRVSGPIRMLGLLVLLSAVAVMHIGLLSLGSGSNQAEHRGTAMVASVPEHSDHAQPDGKTVHHEATHPCVFILTALVFAIGLMLLYRLTAVGDGHLPPIPRWSPHAERPPPRTAPSLAELSILRI